jgi:hypothetical protein
MGRAASPKIPPTPKPSSEPATCSGGSTQSKSTAGSYLLFGFVGLILMFLFVVPLYAMWVLMYSNNKLLIQIERNTATTANAAMNEDHHQSDMSPIDDCLRADPRPR